MSLFDSGLNALATFLSQGLSGASGWQVLVVALVMTHLTIVSVTLYLGPLWNAVMAWMVLGEQLGAHHWVGALMILPGIYLATRKPA